MCTLWLTDAPNSQLSTYEAPNSQFSILNSQLSTYESLNLRNTNIVIMVKNYYKQKSQNRNQKALFCVYLLHKNEARQFPLAKVALQMGKRGTFAWLKRHFRKAKGAL